MRTGMLLMVLGLAGAFVATLCILYSTWIYSNRTASRQVLSWM